MYSYPYDPTGKAATNKFNEEHLIVATANSLRVVVLQHRPFFKPLTITYGNSNTPLTEGVDFEYAYELVELDDSVAGPVYMGVNLLNPAIVGSVRFSGQHLGGTFYYAYYEMMDDLVKHLNNPISASWLTALHRPALFPPMPAATSWDDLLNKKYLASAIRDLKIGSEAAHAIIKAKLDDLKNVIDGIYADIVAFNYPGHQAEENPHNTTVVQIGAHPAAAKVPDAMMAYGKKLKTLTAEIRALGLKQADIDKYVAYNCLKGVSGTFVQLIAANRPLFRSPNGETELLFTDSTYELKSNGSVVLAVGTNLADTTQTFIEWTVGTNKLRITSSGNSLGMASLTLNGAALLNAVTIQDYQSDGSGGSDPDDNQLIIQGVGINFTGKGSKTDPVKGTLVIPKATKTVPGAMKIKSTPGAEIDGYGAATDAAAQYVQQQSGFVLKDTMVNNKSMAAGSVTLTKADFTLGLADNTSDANKPVSTAQQQELDDLSPTNHKHDWSELGIVIATATEYGITKLAGTNAGLAALKAVAPAVLVDLAARAATLKTQLLNVDPSSVVDFAAIDASAWSVDASRVGLSVQDLRYFYVYKGARKEGMLSATVNLGVTPMFNWMQPSNVLESRFPQAVRHDTQYPNTEVDLPTGAITIGRTANEMGKLAYSAMLFKERVKIPSGELRVRVNAGGKITLYVDGTARGTAVDEMSQKITIDPNGEHVVAIRVDPDDPAKAAAVWYDIMDDTFTVALSHPGTPVGTLDEFYVPLGMRHYLYLNMTTGSVFSRAELADTPAMDLTKMFIGAVDVPVSGLVSGAVINHAAIVDYGEFRELATHAAKTTVHKPQLSDFVISDAPNALPKAMGSFNPFPRILWSNGSCILEQHWGWHKMSLVGSAGTPCKFQLGFDTRFASPAHWVVSNNPFENGQNTIDGVFYFDTLTADDLGQDLWFYVCGVRPGNFSPMISLNPFTDTLKQGLSMMTSEDDWGATTKSSWVERLYNATLTVLSQGDEVIPYDQFGYEHGEGTDASVTLATRGIVRYRYVPSTRVLRVCYELLRGAAKSCRRYWKEYKLSLDIAHLFIDGVVGIERKLVTQNLSYRIQAGWMPMIGGSAGELERKFQYVPALVDTYASTDLASSGVIQDTDTGSSPYAYGDPDMWGASDFTEFAAKAQHGGVFVHNHGSLWPHHLFPRPATRLVPKLATAQLWDYTDTDYAGIRLNRPIAVMADVPEFTEATLVAITVSTNVPGSLWLGETNLTSWFPAPSGTLTTTNVPSRLIPAVPNCKRNRLVVQLEGAQSPVSALKLNVKLTFNNAGVITEWDMAGPQDVYDTSAGPRIAKSNPWCMTQRVSDLLRAKVKEQKTG